MIPHWRDETHRVYTPGSYLVNAPLTLDESIQVHDFEGVTVYFGERYPIAKPLFTNEYGKIINNLKTVGRPYISKVVN